jgi:dCMP deaminase
MRIDKINYYLNIAEVVLERSTCIRRNFGTIIVNNDIIISTGYNGSIRGDNNCCDKNQCPRNQMNCDIGEGYEHCVAVHAEQNALLNISRKDASGGSIFLVGIDVETKKYFPIGPCVICLRLIKAIGIHKIYVRESKVQYKVIDV